MTFIADIMVGYSWYSVLYPSEVVTHAEAVGSGAVLMLVTLLTLALNALVYLVAIAEDS